MRNPSKALPVLLLSLLAGPTGCAQILDLPDTVECGSDDACTTNDNPCVLGECVDGTCAFTLVAEGEVVGALEAGDCQQLVCDGAGAAVTAPDPTDAPADDTPGDCKVPACSEAGAVVEDPAEDAPADETPGDCKAPACEDGAVVDGPAEDAPTDGVTGDCSRPACDGGAVVDAADDEDAPTDDVPGDCESPTCDGGQIVIEVNPADLPPDIAGDCLAAECGAQGLLIDDNDVPTTGCGGCANGVVVPWTEAGMTCYTGAPAELNVPNTACNDGTWACVDNAKICEGEQLPVQESCGPGTSGVDDDCNGQTDESGPGCACQLGMTQTCYEGPPGTGGVGTCTTGLSSCMATPMGNQYGDCVGDTFPETCDSCLDNLDEDCAGGAATCTGNHVFSKGITNVDGVFGRAVAVLPNGEILVAAEFKGNLSAPNNLTSDGESDIALIRFDADGNAIQAREFGGAGFDIPASLIVVSDGYILGGTLGAGSTETFGSGSTLASVGDDVFVAKFDFNHQLVWKKLLGGTGDDYLSGIEATSTDAFVLVGSFSSSINLGGNNLVSAGMSDIFVAGFAADGEHVWSRRFGSAAGDDFVWEATVMPNGDIVLGGQSSVSLVFGATTLTNAGSLDGFVVRLDATGLPLWARGWQSPGVETVTAVTAGTNDSVWALGNADTAMNADGVVGNDVVPTGAGRDLAAVNYSSAGALLGSFTLNSSAIAVPSVAIASPVDGAIVVGGNFSGMLSTPQFNAAAGGFFDGFLLKLDPNQSQIVWSRKTSGTNSEDYRALGFTPCGDLLTVGTHNGSDANFGGGALPWSGASINANMPLAKYRQ
jgi:hypothetical protein